MARGPDVVIVARHGARLDAADKTWHLTSPTPYDPPLTYGGWSQGNALGLRIASLLHARDLELEKAKQLHADPAHLESSSSHGGKGVPPAKKRRHKIVLHSSPFQRCIQTSTAIAAGIAQFQPPAPVSTTVKIPHPPKERNNLHGDSPLSRTPASTSPAVQPVSFLRLLPDPKHSTSPKPHIGPDKIHLRIDAFLGEWLSPDYYEDITPPPNSTMMVAGAKADLLRRGDYIEVQPNANALQTKGHFPGGWVKSGAPSALTSRKNTEDEALSDSESVAQVLPLRERSGSLGSIASQASRTSHRSTYLSTAHKAPDHIYDPPVPSYALSASNPIPRGYVAHARDDCIKVDWQWDSMRPPQEWGDGGEFGDEWSTMHKRFRRGLAGMMSWYGEHGSKPPKDMFPGFTLKNRLTVLHQTTTLTGSTAQTTVEEDEDLVLILVTHGAGCNALLGAMTNQPVLIDVGLAALSMAIKRNKPQTPPVSTMHPQQASVLDSRLADEYEMRIMASLDHLRPGVDPSKLPQPQSPAVLNSPSGTSLEYRRRLLGSGGVSSPTESPSTFPEPYRGPNSALGSIRRSFTAGSFSSRLLSSNLDGGFASPAMGLWSANRASAASSEAMQPATFSNTAISPTPTSSSDSTQQSTSSSMNTNGNTNVDTNGTNRELNKQEKEEEKSDKVHNGYDDGPSLPIKKGTPPSQGTQGLWGAPKPSATQPGLWGPPKLDEVYVHTPGRKRRWTVTEKEYEG